MASMAGAANVGDFASAIGVRAEEATIIAELKAGSEDAYAWLVGEFHQPVYSVIYRPIAAVGGFGISPRKPPWNLKQMASIR
jgi:hypothetical protein